MIMNNYCKRCRLRDGCLQKCKWAEIYEQGYNDAVEEIGQILSILKIVSFTKEESDGIQRKDP